MKFIISLLNKYKIRKKIVMSFLFFIVFYLSTDYTSAFTADDVTETVEFAMKVVSVLLGVMTYLATIFLSPEWYNGNLFGLNTYFKDVWILVSNVVYFIFAFILIWIAFMNIIGKNADQYQLKQALPKFIVGVLIVPFSWFLVQFVLSVSAVLTIGSLTLPYDTFENFGKILDGTEVPKICTIDLRSGDDRKKDEKKSDGFVYCDEKGAKVNIKELLEGDKATNSIFGIISLYTYGVLSFDTIDDISKSDLGSIKNIGDLIVKLLFDALFVLVYAILLITLGMVLMIRGIYIWIYTMMSPIFGLMYFFDKKDGGEGFFGKFNLKEFIALAMVPVYTMLALSFGLLFLYVVGSGMATGSLDGVKENELFRIKYEEPKDGDPVNYVEIGGKGMFRLNILGAVAKGDNVTNFLEKVGDGGLGIIGGLILKVFGIVVLWGTLMAAMRTSEITKQITQPIYDFGTKVGQIAASAPGNIPIFGGMSAKGLEQVGVSASSYFGEKSRKTGTDFLEKHRLFGTGPKTAATTSSALQASKEQAGTVNAMKKMSDAIHSYDRLEDMKGKKDLIEAIKNNSKELGVDTKYWKELSDKSTAEEIKNAIFALDAKSENTNKGSIISGHFQGGKGDTVTIGQFNEYLAQNKEGGNNNNGGNNSSNNIIQVQNSDKDGRVLNITLNNEKIYFDDNGRIGNGSYDNFARSVNGMSYEQAKKLFNSKLPEDSFDDLFKEIQDELGNEALSVKDGNIQIDLSKKK